MKQKKSNSHTSVRPPRKTSRPAVKKSSPFEKFYREKDKKKDDESFTENRRSSRSKLSDNTDEKPKRSFIKDESKSFGSRNDKPTRSYGRDESKSYGSRDDKPTRSYSRDESKSYGSGNDKPTRSYGRDESKSYGSRDDKPTRSFGRDESKSYDSRNDKPTRSYSNDRESKPETSTKKDDNFFDVGSRKSRTSNFTDKPKRSYERNESKSYDNRDERTTRSFSRDESKSYDNRSIDSREGSRFAKDRFSSRQDNDRGGDRRSSYNDRSDYRSKNDSYDRGERHSYNRSNTNEYDDFKRQFFGKNADDYKPKNKKSKKDEVESSGVLWLNKFLAQAGICSRRKAADLIKDGTISVNGVKETNPAYEVKPEDNITYLGKPVQIEEKKIYLIMNKPKNVITTSDDEKGRRTVLDLVKEDYAQRLFPVGRLDKLTTGLLLLTNDGDLTKKLTHPSHQIKKVYAVTLDKNLALKDLEKIKDGVTLEDGVAEVDSVDYIGTGKKNEIGVELHSGKNRIVRRIFESLGYVVEKLDRTLFAGLTKKDLPRGFYRELTEKEIIMLRHFTNMRKG